MASLLQHRLGRAAWVISTYGVSLSLRLGSNIILSRLLAPDLLGVMVFLQSIRIGFELLSDVGVEQNIVSHPKGAVDPFFNTAWTVQIVRGAFLSVAFLCSAPVFGRFFGVDTALLMAMSAAPLLTSLASTSIFVLVKSLDVKRRNIFEFTSEAIGFLVTVALAYSFRSVWALVCGALIAISVRSALSYLLPHPRHRFMIDRLSLHQIFAMGRWIAATSLLTYVTTYADRLFFGKIESMQFLGIYGLARVIAELPGALTNRIGYQLVFPKLALEEHVGVPVQSSERRYRSLFLHAAAVALAVAASVSDWLIKALFDPRYTAAGWMLFILLLGAWGAVLSNLAEATLTARNAAKFGTLASSSRLAFLVIALPTSFILTGPIGAIISVSTSEWVRYAAATIPSKSLGLPDAREDATATLSFLAVLALCLVARSVAGMGAPWTGMIA